jgi:hypothetical protein
MAYNPDAVSSMSPGIRLLFYATSSPFLAATPSPVAIRLMHSATFSLPRRISVCVDKEPSITGLRTHSRCDEIQGLTFEQIARAMNKDEVWVAALFYGQVSSILVRVQACVEYTSR